MTPDAEHREAEADDFAGLLDYFRELLTCPVPPENPEIINRFGGSESFRRLSATVNDLRGLSYALRNGDLESRFNGRGYVLSNLKALQSNLRHLTWQTQKIAEGDFTQRVDYLGNFSESFNEMTAKLKAYSEKLNALANMDQLTGLPNRHYLVQLLPKYFSRYLRDKAAFSIVLLDIDRFKAVNDTYGHDAGDRVLAETGGVLNEVFRSSDIFVRYGGEEFLAALPGTDEQTACAVAERARAAAESNTVYLPEYGDIQITISLGVSQVRPEDPDYETVIKRSDEALYAAKRNGRNRVEVL